MKKDEVVVVVNKHQEFYAIVESVDEVLRPHPLLNLIASAEAFRRQPDADADFGTFVRQTSVPHQEMAPAYTIYYRFRRDNE